MSQPDFITTRRVIHAVAEHILAAARYQAVGRIGLAVVPGGFATPPFGDDERTVSLIGAELIASDGAGTSRTELTTLRAAGEFLGISPGAPADVYTPVTPCDLDAQLVVDPSVGAEITAWYELVNAALEQFRTEVAADDPSPVTLWPEHFDNALRAAEVNYGGLAGDEGIAVPYLYVGPSPEVIARGSEFWNQPFGAVRTFKEITDVSAAVAFLHEGRDLARS